MDVVKYLRACLHHAKQRDARAEALWLMVLLQATMDAASNVQRSKYRVWKLQARAWLTSADPDFQFVCENAGLDHGWLRSHFTALYAQAEQRPAPPPMTYGCDPYGQLYIADWLDDVTTKPTNHRG